MAIDITALYCCLDDFCKVFADWEAHQLIPSPTRRQRSGKLSRAEMARTCMGILLSSSFRRHQPRFCLRRCPRAFRHGAPALNVGLRSNAATVRYCVTAEMASD